MKAITMDLPDIKISAKKSNPSVEYLITLYTSQYDPKKNFIPIEIANIGNQKDIQNRMLSMILRYDVFQSLSKEDYLDLKNYVDYMIGEVLSNAITHSCSNIGAVITGQIFPQQRKLQICIVDRGVGFLYNLQKRYKDVKTEEEAIIKALEKGVSSPPIQSNPYYSQISHAGYGLYVLKTIIEKTEGNLLIISNNGVVKLTSKGVLSKTINTSWKGVIVAFEFFEDKINYSFSEFMKIFVLNNEDEIF
ncbi:hypothetical protein JCM14244_11180 [Venenivibrio stagnispumantis]|nr:ATP-binding protein [Venenivibrio stagnispumantis]MCW4573181.1 ATP-binding protein [Venenivibrio stagnispumantis]